MNDFLHSLFYSGPFMPHGHCYLWTPGLLWLHVISDALIVFSYFTIPVTLLYFVRRRKDMRFSWMFVCFAVFIIACGTSHLMEIWNVWHGNYWLSGGVKAVTAMASVPTAFLLTRLVSPALKLPSMTDLTKLNTALEQEVATRTAAEGKVRAFNVELERRVEERTAELHALNEDLRRQMVERERAQGAARESEERFRQLADAMPQIVFAGRPDGHLDYYNQQWYDYTGLPSGATGNEAWNRILHPDDFQRTLEVYSAALRSGELYENEFRLKRASDGEYRWFLGRALPIKDEDGNVLRWFGTDTDIHERKQLQEQNEQLLASERAARSEADRTSQMKDEFLATLSHELRTPLNAILGWSQVLRDGHADPEDLSQGLATIERNARAQTQIIEDLLDMSRIVAGKVRLDVQRLDLAPALEAAIETMRPAADAKGIRLQAVLDPQALPISGDPNRLQQIFWNLLSNAIKFTSRGGRVQVVLERVNSHLEVSISDTGEGIDAAFLPHVFDRFRQADATTTRQHGGLGLGLAIVKQLVELHGGSVRAKSDGLGLGTTFIVAFPLTVLHAEIEPEENERCHPQASSLGTSLPGRGSLNLQGVKVLVVDDEMDARALVKRFLEDRGATVRTAGSAAEALRLLEEATPDVLVSDIGMPGEDGYALIHRVRALPAAGGGTIPAIALTAYARSEDRMKVILAGFQMHVAKPVEPAELLTMIASLAGRTGSH